MPPLKPPLPRLLLDNVSCMRNAQQILRHVNVSMHDGSALVLTGAIGSGKTTFLRMLAGFTKPSAGQVLWNGHDVTESGVFHQYKLQLNWLTLKDAVKPKFTVLENVQWFEVLESKEGNAVPAIELMGLGRLMNEKARMLSMGQLKRLQLARLLALDRPIWLLDEPSVALDDEGVRLLEYIIAEHRKRGWIVFVATHLPIQIEDAMYLRLPPRFPWRWRTRWLHLTQIRAQLQLHVTHIFREGNAVADALTHLTTDGWWPNLPSSLAALVGRDMSGQPYHRFVH